MATYTVPGQQLSFQVPDDGEVFRSSNDPNAIFVRQGNKFYSLSLQDLGMRSGQHITSGAQAVSIGAQLLKSQYGIDFNAIPVQNYNLGDVGSVFGNSPLTDLSLLKSTPSSTGEVLTQGVSATNPNAPTLSSSVTGNIDLHTPTLGAPGALNPSQTGPTNPNANFNYGPDGTQPPAGTAVPGATTAPGTPSAPAMASIPQITGNLGPGSSGADVVSLQKWLVSQGYLTQAEMDTGPGTYGPKTTAAVSAWQKAAGVPVPAGQEGYFGPVSKQYLGASASTASTPATQTGGGEASNPELDAILNNPQLTADQKALIKSLYGAVSTNDTATADKIKAGIAAASSYSDPFFKAQTRLAIDALDRAFGSADGDLSYNESKLTHSLDALRKDITASKDSLSLDEQQQLKDLERNYQDQLDTTQQDLASRGFTSSSIRSKKEQILNTSYGDMVQSDNRSLTEKTSSLDRQLQTASDSTALDIQHLRDLAAAGKLTDLRSAEAAVGSDALSTAGYTGGLGGIGGTIPRAQAQDALSFASSFVF